MKISKHFCTKPKLTWYIIGFDSNINMNKYLKRIENNHLFIRHFKSIISKSCFRTNEYERIFKAWYKCLEGLLFNLELAGSNCFLRDQCNAHFSVSNLLNTIPLFDKCCCPKWRMDKSNLKIQQAKKCKTFKNGYEYLPWHLHM